jgi:hypothetical protein
VASLRGLLPPVARFWTMWRWFQRRSGRGGPFPPRMLLSLRMRQFRLSRCFDSTMGFSGEGPFALTPKLKEKETARLEAEASRRRRPREGEGKEAECRRERGSRVQFEHMRAAGIRACLLRMCSVSRSHHNPPCACHGGASQPEVELKCTCNNVGCTAEKKGNFWCSNAARTR